MCVDGVRSTATLKFGYLGQPLPSTVRCSDCANARLFVEAIEQCLAKSTHHIASLITFRCG